VEQDSSAFVADREFIQALEKRSKPVFCGEDRILFCQGEPPNALYFLRSGEAVLILQSESGEVAMCLRAPAGSLLGLPAIIGNEPYSMTAKAREGSEVRFVTRSDFEELIQRDPKLSFRVLQVLAAEVRSARQALSTV
jgi:CRP/FNR family transcriptional regulator, cyclic AMP receptor protein